MKLLQALLFLSVVVVASCATDVSTQHWAQNPYLVNYGGQPPYDALPLQVCEGDCDHDNDCEYGLLCFKRDGGDKVPGCRGGAHDTTNTDYCVKAEYWYHPTRHPTPQPTHTPAPNPTDAYAPNPTHPPTHPPAPYPTHPPTSKATRPPMPHPTISHTPPPTLNPTQLYDPIPNPANRPTPHPSLRPSRRSPHPTGLQTPHPTLTASNTAQCSANPSCTALGLTGACCPTAYGVTLDCCQQDRGGGGSTAACSANPRCKNLSGKCCPTKEGIQLSCCGPSH